MRYIAVKVAEFADGKASGAYQIFEELEPGVYVKSVAFMNHPVNLVDARKLMQSMNEFDADAPFRG